MDKERVAHMLHLGHKKREGLISTQELAQLDALRKEYLRDFREGFSQQLSHVRVEQEDGTYLPLQKKTDIEDTQGDC